MPSVYIKRAYEPPSPEDGVRILVDRVWPRGIRKDDLAISAWNREVAPSVELRRWFGHQVKRWEEFRRRYRKELAHNPSAVAPLLEAARRGRLTLVYAAKDASYNQAIVLQEFLEQSLSGNGPLTPAHD